MKIFLGIILATFRLLPYARAAEAVAVASAGSSPALPPPPPALPAPSVSCTCPLDYNPVCGTDGNTHSNECVLRCVSAEHVRSGRPAVGVHRPGPCPQEPCMCPAVYQPVCGSDGKTYSNQCALNCENNWRVKIGLPVITVKNPGQCPNPGCVCSSVVIPVCGSNRVTYRNVCFLQCASRISQQQGSPAITYSYRGACLEEACPCTKEYKPLCGSDGRTYGSNCLLKCENRRRNALGLAPLTIRNDGPCYSCDCPNVNDPVCASGEKTFKNACFMRCENDARSRIGLPPLAYIGKGACGCACKKYYDPVCGTNDRNYDNICQLHCESVRRELAGEGRIGLAYGGPCACNCGGCNPEYAPVCGSDGRTYWNLCWLGCYSDCNKRRQSPGIREVGAGYC